MREDAKAGTHIQGAVELAVSSEVEIMEQMQVSDEADRLVSAQAVTDLKLL